jgi:flagellar hook-basal body complex protein FliE
MVEAINPVNPQMRMAQILGNDFLAEGTTMNMAQVLPGEAVGTTTVTEKINLSGNLFDDILAKSIEALNGLSHQENLTNQMIGGFTRGEVELQDVMVAQAKLNIMVQLATTTINNAVQTFKEVTSMQI